jgi:hypothetical protein
MTSAFILAHTKLEPHCSALQLSCTHCCSALHSLLLSLCYTTAAPTTENIFDSIVETCVLSHCIPTVALLPLLRYWVVT